MNRVVAVALLAGAGCIPCPDRWHPALDGRVIDGHGAPVAGATVVAVTRDTFGGGSRVWRARSAADGSFHFAKLTVVGWLPGEAPRPQTEFVACVGQAPLARAPFGRQEVVLTLGAEPIGDFELLRLCLDR